MASTLEKIKTLLSSNKEESKETKMYAEMILDDGRVLATEDEQFMIGSVVMVVGDDGETSKLSAGTYTMSDGAKLTIDDDSKILDMGEEKEAEEVENEEEKEEMEEHDEADVADWKGMEKRIKNLEDAVADLKADKENMSVETEEEVEEEVKEDEKVEMSKDMVNSLVEEVEHLKAKIVELEKEPGAEGFTHNPENDTKSEKADLGKMSINDRVKYLINN
jgi:TolA-binding protein